MPDLATLPENQQRAIQALLGRNSLKTVAKVSGVDSKTLYRWRHEDEEFRKAYRAASDEAFGDGLAALKSNVFRAVEVLSKAMDSSSVSPRRVAAANAVLRHAIKAVEVLEIAEKQREIERLMEQLEERDRGYGQG